LAFDSTLPDPRTLERTCRGLATIDAMLSAEWELRYFSFNAHWSAGQRMASMRNGSGDEWFFVFGDGWVKNSAFSNRWNSRNGGLESDVGHTWNLSFEVVYTTTTATSRRK